MTAVGRATVVEPAPVDDGVPSVGWLLGRMALSLWPLGLVLVLVVAGLAAAGALGVG